MGLHTCIWVWDQARHLGAGGSRRAGPEHMEVKKPRPEPCPRAPGSLSRQDRERAAPSVLGTHIGWCLHTSPGRSPDRHLAFPFGPSLASCPIPAPPTPFLGPIRAGPVYPDGPGHGSSLRQTGTASNRGWKPEITLRLGIAGEKHQPRLGQPDLGASGGRRLRPEHGAHKCGSLPQSSRPNPGWTFPEPPSSSPGATCALVGLKTGEHKAAHSGITGGGRLWGVLEGGQKFPTLEPALPRAESPKAATGHWGHGWGLGSSLWPVARPVKGCRRL